MLTPVVTSHGTEGDRKLEALAEGKALATLGRVYVTKIMPSRAIF